MQQILINFWNLLLESAPWLVLGYIAAGFINVLIPKAWINKYLGGDGFSSIVKAALIGAPLPLCSCGVIPAAMGIRRAGASRGATASFLVATPETGVDSISLSYVLMGPVMAVARPVSAIIGAVSAGLLVAWATRADSEEIELEADSQPAKSCCSKKKDKAPEQKQSLPRKLRAALSYGLGTMLKDSAKWLLIGLIGAALIKTWVPESFFTQWGDGLLAMLVMVVVGLPMYICASASTPLGAGLMLAGLSPGAALVFMLTGPATNIATLGVVRQELGRGALSAYLFAVVVTAIAMGYLLNGLIGYFELSVSPVGLSHEHGFSWIAYVSVLVLFVSGVRILLGSIATKKTSLI